MGLIIFSYFWVVDEIYLRFVVIVSRKVRGIWMKKEESKVLESRVCNESMIEDD